MPEFISKLQYKTCENGEYYDEKPRTLDETITLIKEFPWVREQYADVELTGPSVTILDSQGNYLKAGIYFGGRFSLYYLDTKNHFYELKQISIDKVYKAVIELFNGQIDLQNFERYSLEFGKKTYFLTRNFEYGIKFWKVIMISIFWNIVFIFLLFFSVATLQMKPVEISIIPIIPTLIIGRIIVRIFEKYYNFRNQYLKISRGNDEFAFGDNQTEIKIYNKVDISKIIHYMNKNSRSANLIEIIEVVFKDGSSINFTNVLISSDEFSFKFSDKWKLSPILVERTSILKML